MNTGTMVIAGTALWCFLFPPVIWWTCDQWEHIINEIAKSRRKQSSNPNGITTIKFTDPPTETQS